MKWTIDDILVSIPSSGSIPQLPAPEYVGKDVCDVKLALAVESMKRHTTDEGWQLMAGLRSTRYRLAGHNLDFPTLDVKEILKLGWDTVVVQDKREWVGRTAGPGFDERERFTNVGELAKRPDIFKLTIVKDAQHDTLFHQEAAQEIGCHSWICYYHPRIVAHLAPFVRPQHLVRTYHTVDKNIVPKFSSERGGCILSGALSGAYPLRKRLFDEKHKLPETHYQPHPGYGRSRCWTPQYIELLSGFKVAICTASVYGYALRKLVESTACGCMVLTDLPSDDVLPMIDDNLWRIRPDTLTRDIAAKLDWMLKCYDPIRQEYFAGLAKSYYDYRAEGKRLAESIEDLRRHYND